MAEYKSSLTAESMDSAMSAMPDAEAYAIGKRNGVDVTSGDVAYHNNSKYYAEQAGRLVPASGTPAVRYDIDQTELLTDAEKEQARENINAADADDVQEKITESGILKGDGTGGVSAAEAGTDYQSPLVSGTNIKTVNGDSLLGSGNLEISTPFADLLWTNSNPSAGFAAQTISLDLSEYNFVMIMAAYYASASPRCFDFICPVGGNGLMCGLTSEGKLENRSYNVTTNGVEFFAGHLYNSYATSTDNGSALVPYKIYGIE